MKGQVLKRGDLTAREWAQRINARFGQMVEKALPEIFAVGDDLLAAKEGPQKLPHGEFSKMLDMLKFNRQVARMFMAIARDERLRKRDTYRALPPHHQTVYQISRLDDDTLERCVEQKVIRPDCRFSDIGRVLRIARVQQDEARIMSLVPKPGKYRTIVVDPAWEYDWLSLAGRAKPGYAMQNLAELHELNLRQWAEDQCHLYCWTTNNFMYEASKLVEHWGFQHRTILTWVKPAPFGLGSYFRNSTEHVIFATRGKTTTREAAASIPTHFESPRGEHSEKPERFYQIVRAASFPPYGEGNQRKARPDFTSLFETSALKLPEAAE
jgi:N6-adenosine-specific RNA methylase IME4